MSHSNPYRTMMEYLDNLVKSRFIEMFVDVIKSGKPVSIGSISELCTVGIANSATHAYRESGVVMLRNQNIKENCLDDSDLVYIDESFASKYSSKKLKENDIIIMRTGYAGQACLVPKKYEGSQTFTTLILRLKENADVTPFYVCRYINSIYGKKYVNTRKVGSSQENFGAKVLEKMPIVVPPKHLQLSFESFCQQVDKSKFILQFTMECTYFILTFQLKNNYCILLSLIYLDISSSDMTRSYFPSIKCITLIESLMETIKSLNS